MIFAHPYREAQVTASVYDEFAKQASLSFKSARTSRSLDLARGPISDARQVGDGRSDLWQ